MLSEIPGSFARSFSIHYEDILFQLKVVCSIIYYNTVSCFAMQVWVMSRMLPNLEEFLMSYLRTFCKGNERLNYQFALNKQY